jgi:hypothetical protein
VHVDVAVDGTGLNADALDRAGPALLWTLVGPAVSWQDSSSLGHGKSVS